MATRRAKPLTEPRDMVTVTPEMVEAAIHDIDDARMDAMSGEDLIGQIADNPDAAPLLSDAESFAALVAATRRRTGLAQAEFALRFRILLGTLRDWEQGRRVPDKPGLALLQAIQKEPETMARLLAL